MKLLFAGDIVGSRGCRFFAARLRGLRALYAPDAVIANGENSADGNGATPESLEALFAAGADLITLGNHGLRRREVYEYLDRAPYVVRPANLHPDAPGRGFCVWDRPGRPPLTVVNLLGVVGMEPVFRTPFEAADALLPQLRGVSLVDLHAEATSEKLCFALEFDGRFSAVVGTHTHIQTADERILPGGTGYLTDAGMCGSFNSALGVGARAAIERFRTGLPARFAADDGAVRLSGVLLDIDDATLRTTRIERINIE